MPAITPKIIVRESVRRVYRILRVLSERYVNPRFPAAHEFVFWRLRLLLALRKCTQAERDDINLISKSGLLSPEYSHFLHRHIQNTERSTLFYLRSWANCYDPRKPFPGFHPGIYEEELSRAGRAVHGDPFAHYIRENHPPGPWNFEVLTPATPIRPFAPDPRAALHIHAFYPDLVSDILGALLHNISRPTLLISVTTETARSAVDDLLASTYDGPAEIRIVPNRGRDLGPLFTGFRDEIMQRFDIVGHIHTKKSPHIGTSGSRWFQFLLEHAIGGKAPMLDIALSAMCNDARIGMIFPDDPQAIGWTNNRLEAEKIASHMPPLAWREAFVFPAGSVFWARTEAIKPFFALDWTWDDYPQEPLPVDGTMLHAVERLLPFVVEVGGYRLVLSHVPGIVK